MWLSVYRRPSLNHVPVLCIAPKSIYLCQLFTSSLWLSALYHIIDQSTLGGSGWGRERVGLEKESRSGD
uniref:Uncharacterized protein n=1 Tax=Felis catus TaxID=9685 RepID=A0ABI7Y9H6_FELCA